MDLYTDLIERLKDAAKTADESGRCNVDAGLLSEAAYALWTWNEHSREDQAATLELIDAYRQVAGLPGRLI